MNVRIEDGWPPNIGTLREKFPLISPGLAFAWGNAIYVPGIRGGMLPLPIYEHELVHCRRQLPDVDGWWTRYLDDVAFRFEEERLAHRAEMLSLARSWGMSNALPKVAKKLRNPLYGFDLTLNEAKRCLLRAP